MWAGFRVSTVSSTLYDLRQFFGALDWAQSLHRLLYDNAVGDGEGLSRTRSGPCGPFALSAGLSGQGRIDLGRIEGLVARADGEGRANHRGLPLFRAFGPLSSDSEALGEPFVGTPLRPVPGQVVGTLPRGCRPDCLEHSWHPVVDIGPNRIFGRTSRADPGVPTEVSGSWKRGRSDRRRLNASLFESG